MGVNTGVVAAGDSWYAVTESSKLSQGDFLDNCPVVLPPDAKILTEKPKTVDIQIASFDVVILTQSCDLDYEKVNTVIVCPHLSLEEITKAEPQFDKAKVREECRRGYLPGYHMLAESKQAGFERGVGIADFHSVFALPLDFLKDFVALKPRRLQLVPPYIEHLSQAFAHFYMRVALPQDIPAFK